MSIKGAINTITTGALFLVTCALAGSGLLLELRLDEEDGPSRILGMGADDWGDLHFAIALAFLGLAAMHGVLHGAWFMAKLRQHRLATVIVFAVGILFVTFILAVPESHGNGSNGGERRERADCGD